MHKVMMLAAAALTAAATPALAIDAPRLSQADLRAAQPASGSGTPRYCLAARAAGETEVTAICATRAEWRERGVILSAGRLQGAK
ncbi:hypothetical protein [Sphingomonas sp.]|uniref:hypothetical protein n=1 Tax=Sphingomonas sp. TaxID=28214 RepID=UPI001D8A888E|nr:hypothetical protein [Sphingomonas sp.]MBX9797180.1 hypothetical protein [Sphingomonas sp.]